MIQIVYANLRRHRGSFKDKGFEIRAWRKSADEGAALFRIWTTRDGGQRSEGQRAEGRRQKAEGRRQKAEGRGQKAEGRRQKAEGRRQRAVRFSATS
jgi:hypothetical protein